MSDPRPPGPTQQGVAGGRSSAGLVATGDTATGGEGATKAALRREIIARRAARPIAQRLADDRARLEIVLAALRDVEPSTIAIYLSVSPHHARPEPGTIELATALWTLGHRLLAPVLSPTADGPRHEPAWAWFEGPAGLRPGLWGIPEPSGEALDATSLASCDLVIASALAATRTGARLGVGGGWYDRALTHARPRAQVWALINDDELLDGLPTESHDRAVDALVRPAGFLRCQRTA